MESYDVLQYTGYFIRRAQQAHVAAWQREVSSEITSVQFGVMSVLSQVPGASQKELCTRLDLDRSTIADLVARLERRGILQRIRDEVDKRRNVLHLTAAGARELEILLPRVARVDQVLTDGLDAEDRVMLRRILAAMLESPSVEALRSE
jgi:DNA-binding MarR family transcriptional regulator